MHRQAALRALAFKWIRILYRCWVDRVPYDEARYLLAASIPNSPSNFLDGPPQGLS